MGFHELIKVLSLVRVLTILACAWPFLIVPPEEELAGSEGTLTITARMPIKGRGNNRESRREKGTGVGGELTIEGCLFLFTILLAKLAAQIRPRQSLKVFAGLARIVVLETFEVLDIVLHNV